MEKKIQDYLHFYLGCQAMCSTKDFPKEKHTGKIVEISTTGSNHSPWIQVAFETVIDVYRDSFRCGHSSSNMHHFFFSWDEIKPILRPWSDLKPDEVGKMTWDNDPMWWAKKSKKGKITISYDSQAPTCFRPEEYRFLCSLGIDLFGLIPADLAIDSTTLNPPATGQ
jgi:hypothetical protein